MISKTEAGAERRRLVGAALIGSGLGLGLGAVYLAAGMAGHAADHAHSQRMLEAATSGYEATRPESVLVPAPVMAEAGKPSKAKAKADKKPKRRSELECLTQAVYYEARGEGANGQFAVAQVVMNRVRHPAFPKSVCGVVFQGAGRRGCQFSFACDGSMRGRREASAWTRARKVASRVLSGAAIAEVGAATHFHTTGVSPAWGPQMRRVAQVGVHVFYRFNPRKPKTTPTGPVEALEAAVLTAQAITTPPELQLQPTVSEATAAVQASSPEAPAAEAAPKAVDSAPAAAQPADVTAS